MNKQQYERYQKRVERFFEAEGITNLSAEGEPYFSHSTCNCCKSNLAGDRYDATGYHPESGEVYNYDICSDCVYYAEYGQLDDMTMMDIEDSE